MTDLSYLVLPKDQFWYFASPYSKYPDGLEAAFKEVCLYSARAINRGIRVFSPIAHSHPIAETGLIKNDDHTTWLALDNAIMNHAHGCLVLMMGGWEQSKGIKWELEQFEAWGKPILFIEPEELL